MFVSIFLLMYIKYNSKQRRSLSRKRGVLGAVPGLPGEGGAGVFVFCGHSERSIEDTKSKNPHTYVARQG